MISNQILVCGMIALMSGVSLSQDRVMYNAGSKQDLLSPAAAYAIEEGDVEMLNLLKRAGWDASKSQGYMPNGLYHRFTPITYAALLRNEKSIAWLVSDGGILPNSRDGNLQRAIDIIVDRKGWQGEVDQDFNLNIISLDVPAKESDALEELTSKIVPKFGLGNYTLKKVNNELPGKRFEMLGRHLSAMKLLHSDQKALQGKRDLELGTESKVAPKDINIYIKWNKVDHESYEFSVVDSDGGLSGGGVSGIIYFMHGYWLTKDLKVWDT